MDPADYVVVLLLRRLFKDMIMTNFTSISPPKELAAAALNVRDVTEGFGQQQDINGTIFFVLL